jgi:hypothetical protein
LPAYRFPPVTGDWRIRTADAVAFVERAPVQFSSVVRTYVEGAEREGREETLVIAQHGSNHQLDVFGQGLQLSGPRMAAIGTCDSHV